MYAYEFQEDFDLLVLVFRGDVSIREEEEAFRTAISDPRTRPGLNVLVERSESTIRTPPQDVRSHSRLVESQAAGRMDGARVAIVVSSDADYGMVRMLQGWLEDRLDHESDVFRDLDEACAWLKVDRAKIRWPEPEAG